MAHLLTTPVGISVSQTIRIATRKSPLALWQAEFVKAKLLEKTPNLDVQLVAMTTRGDVLLDTPLAKVGGKGLFVKELEVAMLDNRADIAVHSMKDVPMEFPPGLGLAVVCEREDPPSMPLSPITTKPLRSFPMGPLWAPRACAASAKSEPNSLN